MARLTLELEQIKTLVAELRREQSQPLLPNSPPRPNGSVRDDLTTLRRDVDRLDKEVERLNGIVQAGLETRRKDRGENTLIRETRVEEGDLMDIASEDDLERIKRDIEKRQQAQTRDKSIQQGPSKLRQGLHQSAATHPTLMPPTIAPPTRVQPRQHPTPPTSSDEGEASPTPTNRSKRSNRSGSVRIEGPSSPFPSIREEDEDEFFRPVREATQQQPGAPSTWAKNFTSVKDPRATGTSNKQPRSRGSSPLNPDNDGGDVPPQTVLARVVSELEADFAHYKA